MGLHQKVALALVVLMALGTLDPPQVDAQLCFYYLSSIRSYSVAVRTYYWYNRYYYYRCGWWGWRRCSRSYRVYVYYYYYYTAYSVHYIQKHYCCSGYSGVNCDPICYNYCGQCSSCLSPYNCACNSGWTGYSCCSDYNECSYNNGGCEQNCHNTVGSFYCSCNSGYTKSGTHCIDINECLSNNGGCSHTCHNTNGGYSCDCPTGYTLSGGKTCVDINECATNNGGCEQNCINQLGTYHCTCNAGYDLSSNKHNCNDHNECTNGVASCNHHCQNTPGGYYCYCKTGYELDIDDETCIDTNECNSNNGGCAQHCTNTIGSYTCSCDDGYNLHSDGHACVDINECALDIDGCDHFCYNNVGSYTCDCKVGYLLHDDDHSCHDINECLTDNGGCDNDHGYCVNEVGTYHCECNVGFLLDDDKHGCSDHDECATNVHDCDTLAPATCHNSHGSFYCTCPVGFRLNADGRTCDDINECDEHSSGCTQICNNIYGSYFCTCHDGFALDSDQHGCSDIDECVDSPCQDTCNNLIGSYYCSCNTGYQLADDQHSCVGIPCNPQLEAPAEGSISCTGLQVTDETCSFGCRAGFELMGSATRTCQANGLWTGVNTYCQHLYCHDLKPPTNGYISTVPCTSYFESTCEVKCVDGYYVNGPSPHTETCAINTKNELYWYPQYTCQYIPPCLSQPCQHGGMCHEVTMTSYYCDCGDSLYTGQNCETGYISVGDIPPVHIGEPISIPIAGTPDNSVSLTVTVSSSAVNVSQTQYTFDSSNPSSSIELSISTPGIYSISYALSGEDADNYDTPDPSILIVTDPDYNHVDNDYFLKNGVEIGELAEGCCSPGVQYQCPGVVNTVSFSSSCAWDNLGPTEFTTPGVVFAKGEDIKIPVSITGAHLMMSEDSYDGFVLPDLSGECRVCDNTDPVNCKYFDFTANDYLDLLETRALETTYLKAIDSLLPSWMTVTIENIEITGQTAFGVDDFTSYLTTGENIYEIPGCESLDLEPDSLFAVLSQDKNITVDIDGTAIKYTPSDSEGPVCFAVNLCKGSSSPVHITVPSQAVEYITSYEAIQAYINSGWTITFKEFLMSNNDLQFMNDGHTSLADTYWVGTDTMVSSSDVVTNFEWRSNVEFKRQFWQEGDNLGVNVSFSGDVYHQSSPSGDDVEGVLSGDLSLSLTMSVNGKQGYMSLFTTSTAALFTMPGSTSSSSAIPSGISMRSTYNKNSMDQIFKSILPIPDGQDSCPVDVFISLTAEGEVNYIRMRTDCLNVVAGGYQYAGDFTQEVYITGKSIPSTPSEVPEDTVFAVYSYLNDDEIQLTDFYSIQQPTNGDAAMVLIFGANANSAAVTIAQASFSLLGTTFTTSLTVDANGISFSTDGTVSLYGGIETTLSGTIPLGSSWDDFVINLQGTFSSDQGSFQSNAQEYIYGFTDSLIQDSEERLEASTIAANDATYAQTETDNILNNKQNAVNELMQWKDQAMNNYQNAQQGYNDAWQQYSNLEATASNEALESVGLLRNICMATDEELQNECLSSANCKLMSMSTEVLEWGLKKKSHTEQRLVHSVRDVTKLKWGIENYCQLITVIQGWGRTRSAQRCSYIAAYDNITNTMLDAYYDTVEVMRTEAAVTESGTFSYNKKKYNLNACSDSVADAAQHYTYAACDSSRKIMLEGLQNSDDDLVVAFLNFESAKRSMMAAETQMKAAMVAYNASVDELASLKVCLKYTDPNLDDFIQTIQEEEGAIQALKTALQNSNIQDIFSINSIGLDTDFTDSDSIPLTINYNVNGQVREIKTTVELTATPQLINRAIADAVLKDMGMYFQDTGGNRKKRQTVENTFNVDQFQTRCGQLNGIKLYLDTIYDSLQSTYDTYMMAKSNITEAVAMVDSLMANVPTDYPTVDFQYLKDMYNFEISIADLNTQISTAVPVTNRTAALMSLKQALMAHMEGLDNYYYRCWQNDLRKMHSMGFIDTVGHIRCYGVVDCLNMVHEVVGTIARDMPETSTTKQLVLDALPDARSWLIAMSLYNSSLTMDTAMATNSTGMLYLIDMIMRENYWCTDIPVMSMHPQTEISVEVDDTLTVKCKADSVLPVTYSFERNGFLVASGLTTGEFIKQATEYDSGLYQCFATNAVGTVESKLSNVIVYIAPKITLNPERYETFEGDDNGGFFACNATGYPMPQYEWEYSANGDSWSAVKDSKSNELIIPKPTQADEGWYRCKVQTEGSGAIRSSPAHLSVLGVTFSTLSHKVSFLMNITELDLTPGSGDAPAPTPPAETVNLDYFRDQLNLTYTTVDDLHVDFNVDNTQITVHITMSVAMNYSATMPFDEQADWAAMKKEDLMKGIDALQIHVKDGTFWFESEGSYFKAAHISANLNDPVYSCPVNYVLAYSNFLCVTCSIGTYYSMVTGRGICTSCPVTYYSSQDGQTECVRCPERTDTLGTGSMWLTDCIDYCTPNHYSTNGLEECMRCPNNTYSLTYRATECTNCTASDVGVIPQCIGFRDSNPTTDPFHGNITTTIIPAVIGGIVGLLILIVLIIIIIVMAIRRRKSDTMYSNAPITGGGSNPLYAAPQDVLSLVPESEKTEYKVEKAMNDDQGGDNANDVVNPLYEVTEKENTYDDDEFDQPPLDNPYEKLDEYQSKLVQ